MKLYYQKERYAVDGTLCIRTWVEDEYGFEPYGSVTVNLSSYGLYPQGDDYIFIPRYKMTPPFYEAILNDIVEEVIDEEVPIGYGKGVYAKLKTDWENGVDFIDNSNMRNDIATLTHFYR